MELLGQWPKHLRGFTDLTQFHVYNSALCLGTLVLRDPNNAMAKFAQEQIEVAIGLFTSLLQSVNTPRYRRNLQWLQQLQTRASAKIAKSNANPLQATNGGSGEDPEDAEDVELLGWRTRLIDGLGQGRTIPAPPTPAGSQITNNSNSVANQPTPAGQAMYDVDANLSFPYTGPDPTDALVRMLRTQCWKTLTSGSFKTSGSLCSFRTCSQMNNR